MRDNQRVDRDCSFVNLQFNVLAQELFFLPRHILGAHIEEVVLSDIFASALLLFALSFEARHLLLSQDFAEVLIRPQPVAFVTHELFEARG